jgi:cytochrome c peroxidase
MPNTTQISRIMSLTIGLVMAGCAAEGSDVSRAEQGLSPPHFLPNNFPVANEHGFAASFSTAGSVDLAGAFFTPQGTNGRHCGSCHAVANGWSMSAATLQQVFDETDGLDPVFNLLDADRPDAFPSMDALRAASVEQRRAVFTMLLQGKFTRRISLPASREYEVVAFNDPFGVSTATRVFFFRRAMPSTNFGSAAINWDNSNGAGGDLHAGLANQARGNITGAQQGTPVESIVQEIVNYEKAISHAQLILGDIRLDSDGALGGPANRSSQPLVAGPFTMFDAWAGSNHPLKAQIARGQALFNDAKPGRASCRGCHNAANDGQNVAGTLFNIGSSRCDFGRPDMATFVLRNTTTGEERCTTDAGRALRSGAWNDVDRFDVPSLRGVGSRGGYLHNGIATTLTEVVEHYERALNFGFTDQEREDLVTFLKAL